jgi:flagellar hook-associated protein 2
LQTAQDAIIGYEGLTITRGSNEISDVIAGATISLSNTTASSVRLTITSDTSILKTNIQNVVTVYNDLQSLLSNLGSGNITALRDLGISLSQTGNMTFNETKYDSAIASDYTDVVTMLTANTSDQSLFDSAEKGLSQDIATTLESLTDTDGLVAVRSTNADDIVLDHKDELAKLEERMEAVYQRYLSQFAAMESIMASMEGTKDYLKGQFESLSKAYDN